MPANNLINSYSTLDPEKKFVFNAHKSLSSVLKFLQARDPQTPYSPKQMQTLRSSVLCLFLQETLLFKGPCSCEVVLSIPSETASWRLANLGLKLASKLRDKTRKIAGLQLNQDIISHTLDTVEQELSVVDASLLSLVNNTKRTNSRTGDGGVQESNNELEHQRLRELIEFYRGKLVELRAQNQEQKSQAVIQEQVLEI
jgi:hypothetical protein